MTDTAKPDTNTVEGILTLLRGRLARGEHPHQSGDSFPFAPFLEAMNTLHEEMLDQEELALCVETLKAVLSCDKTATLAGFTKPYVDAAFRVLHREQAQAEAANALESSSDPAAN